MLRIWTATLLTWTCAMELQTIDMFRAMQMPEGGNETNRVQNNNMADVLGTLKYIMTEVIVEHVQGDPARTARKYNIDSVGHYRVQVRNPHTIQEGGVMGFSNQFSAFDYGVATSQPALEELEKVGDFVGIQVTDPTVNAVVVLSYPYYWYSLTGACPNLPWTCLRGSNYPSCPTTSEDVGVNPVPCESVGCEGKSAPLADSCKADFSKEQTLTKCCLQYGDQLPKKLGKMLIRGKPIKGGLCKPGVVPTGTPTCVYNYKDLVEEDFVNLDELAGITAMKCGTAGDRTCKDWADWRKNCYDPDKKYKKKFKCDDCHEQGNWQWNWEETDFCVEYDLNPLCQDSPAHCADPQCQALKPEDKEVGLPFWQGRCEERENIRRAEKLAAKALGKDQVENHEIIDKDLLENNPTCSRAANCKPNPNGGPYCSRQFGGVCTPCYIPGTQEPFSNPDNTPTCPFSLKEEIGGPAGVAANTKCKSKSASDLCCLYGVDGSCDKDFADGSKVTTDMEGYLGVMAAAHKDPNQMFNFATKWIQENGGEVQEEDKLKDEVYWMWRIHPPKAPLQAWESFQENLKDSSYVKFTTTTTTTTTTEGTTTTEEGRKPSGDSSNTWKFVLAACVALIVVAVFFWMYRDNQRRQTPDRRSRMEEGEGRSLQMSRM